LAKHPHVRVALAIIRTGAVPLEEDKDDDSVAQSQSQVGRRMGARDRRPNPMFSVRRKHLEMTTAGTGNGRETVVLMRMTRL
jgi:hypothetical protein